MRLSDTYTEREAGEREGGREEGEKEKEGRREEGREEHTRTICCVGEDEVGFILIPFLSTITANQRHLQKFR